MHTALFAWVEKSGTRDVFAFVIGVRHAVKLAEEEGIRIKLEEEKKTDHAKRFVQAIELIASRVAACCRSPII